MKSRTAAARRRRQRIEELAHRALARHRRPQLDDALRIMRDDFRLRLQAAAVPLSVESLAAAAVDAATDQLLRSLGIPIPRGD